MKTTAGCFTLGLLLMSSPGDDMGRQLGAMGQGPLLALRNTSFFAVMPKIRKRRKPVPQVSEPAPASEEISNQPPVETDMIGRLKDIFTQEGVPAELAWIAEIESALNPRARSSAGALGLFQFMPVTARRFGLRTGRDDERTNPLKSARAAAKYLGFLYREFDCWQLAVAAYNAGEGTVSRLLRRHGAHTYAQIAPYLPYETQDFVPRVLDTVEFMEGRKHTDIRPPTS